MNLSNPIDKTFVKLIRDTGLPLKVFSTAASVAPESVLKWWADANGQHTLRDSNLTSFSQYFGFSENHLLSDTYDKRLLRKRFLGKRTDLPEKYEFNARSYLRSSFYILEYLTLMYGRHFSDNLLFEMGVHPLMFQNLDQKINLVFVNDLLNRCKTLGFSESHFYSLAGSLFLSVEADELKSRVAIKPTPEVFFGSLEGIANKFDINFQKNFEVSKNRATIVETLSPEIERFVQTEKINLDFLIFYRKLLYQSSPKLANMPAFKTTIKRNDLRGSIQTTYTIEFPSALLLK